MKNLFLAVLTVIAFTQMVNAQNAQSTNVVLASNSNVLPANAAVCKWEKTTFDFGTVPQGKPVSVVFNFTNSGNAPLIVSAVHPSCGCTTEDYTKDIIAPGKKGFVKLTYNAAAVGSFNKTTTVSTNADPKGITLTFTGNVAAPDSK